MKFTISKLSVLFLIILTLKSVNAQNFQGKAYYESKTTIDMSNFGGGQLSEEHKKQITDRIKSALEKSFILTFNQTESIYKEEEHLENPDQRMMRFNMMSFTGGDQYKNVKEHQLIQENELFGKQFLIMDSLPKLQWELGSETKTIGQYMCFKATAVKQISSSDIASFRGPRPDNNEKPKDSTNTNSEDIKDIPQQIVVTAWYTPQVPVNQGPGEYWGLPGLILEVNAGRTTILCSKIVLNPSEKDEIKKPSKGKKVTKKEYETIVTQKREEMREMFRSGRGTGRGLGH